MTVSYLGFPVSSLSVHVGFTVNEGTFTEFCVFPWSLSFQHVVLVPPVLALRLFDLTPLAHLHVSAICAFKFSV